MESGTITLFSPAKINVNFRVLGRRDDGYHEITSHYQAISLGDTLSVRLSEEDAFVCESLIIHPEQNLVLKAFRLFQKKTGWEQKVSFCLDKQIPVQAGLGGGSSNAATALWALNLLSGTLVSEKELMEWAKELGSDVPFFFSSGSALCTGRGERVLDIPLPQMPATFWIVKPTEGLSTAVVYAAHKPIVLRKDESAYGNDLEETAFQLMPELRKIKERLLQSGFDHVVMTGSGTAFFCFGNASIKLNWSHVDVDTYSVRCITRKPGFWYERENI